MAVGSSLWGTISMHRAKAHLSKLVERAARGEPFAIAKAGSPMVKVVPLKSADRPRRGTGFMAGEIAVPDDLDRMAAGEIEPTFTGNH